MGGLRTLSDAPAKQDAGSDAPAKAAVPAAPAKAAAKQGEGVSPASAEGVSTSLDTSGKGEVADPARLSAAIHEALATQLAAAIERGDGLERDYLAQSDKLAAANAALAKFEDELKERDAAADTASATIAQRDAQIAALGAAPPPPPVEVAVKRPKVGKVLKLPEEGKRASGAAVHGALAGGELLVVALVDANARVQPYPPEVGGLDRFSPYAGGLLFAAAIELTPAMDAIEVRHAVLLDSDGKVLSACRFGALLLGGSGLSALIPGNTLLFGFDA